MASTATGQVDKQVVVEKDISESPKKDVCNAVRTEEKLECVENGKASPQKLISCEADEKTAAEENNQDAENEKNGEDSTPLAETEDSKQKNGHHVEEKSEVLHASPAKSQKKQSLTHTETEEPSQKKARKSLEEKPAVEVDGAAAEHEDVKAAENGESVASLE